jgi:hypothetical protein
MRTAAARDFRAAPWSSPVADGDARPPGDEGCRWRWGLAERMGVTGMAEVRYAVWLRGHRDDVVAVASQEGLEVADDPVQTVLRGPLPDQCALLGILARARLLGLELIEVRRLPQASGW